MFFKLSRSDIHAINREIIDAYSKCPPGTRGEIPLLGVFLASGSFTTTIENILKAGFKSSLLYRIFPSAKISVTAHFADKELYASSPGSCYSFAEMADLFIITQFLSNAPSGKQELYFGSVLPLQAKVFNASRMGKSIPMVGKNCLSPFGAFRSIPLKDPSEREYEYMNSPYQFDLCSGSGLKVFSSKLMSGRGGVKTASVYMAAPIDLPNIIQSPPHKLRRFSWRCCPPRNGMRMTRSIGSVLCRFFMQGGTGHFNASRNEAGFKFSYNPALRQEYRLASEIIRYFSTVGRPLRPSAAAPYTGAVKPIAISGRYFFTQKKTKLLNLITYQLNRMLLFSTAFPAGTERRLLNSIASWLERLLTFPIVPPAENLNSNDGPQKDDKGCYALIITVDLNGGG